LNTQIILSTIGFTQTTAENFFARLRDGNVNRVIDVRLNNTSQLSAFAKARDLEYFLKNLLNVDYVHEPLLAPEKNMLQQYQRKEIDWAEYQQRYTDLIATRKIDTEYSPDFFHNGCLLCSEATAHQCHRRLVVEYLAEHWTQPLTATHL